MSEIIVGFLGTIVGIALTIWGLLALKDNGYITLSATDKLVRILKS
jgi:hypothetical protein